MSRTQPTGTVTFLFSDIEGSTRLAQQHPQDWERLQQRHGDILQAAIQAQAGYTFLVVGDAFCAAFRTADQAVLAAQQAQVALHAENWMPVAIKVRMGIHTGNAEIQPDGQYQGYLTLSRVQRLMSAGHGGQVLLSRTTQQLVQESMPQSVLLRSLGEVKLKDFSLPEWAYQLVIPGCPDEFPPLRTQTTNHNNLPINLTSFIGRERVLKELDSRLAGNRMLTLVGPGGTGKTRLSIQLGKAALSRYPDGVWLVELAPLTNPALVAQAVAQVFGLRESQDYAMADLVTDYLRAKNLLLILDNCEHLVEACAILAEGLLQACPQLMIIASSREALGVSGEAIYRVPSLTLPDPARATPESLASCESVQLFLERAAVAQPGFELTRENAPFAAQVCHRLDGIPLAIELAAARLRVLSVQQIAARLDDRFRLLTGGSRTALPRQQTLRALIDWSYDLLTDREKALFRRLAVFVNGWTLESAEAVCAGAGIEDYEILDLLTQLVDKSLVSVEESTAGARYHRLETIRQYAREKLLETDESMWVRDQHLEHFSQFVQAAEARWAGPGTREVEDLLISEYDNLRAAQFWMLENHLEYGFALLSWSLVYALWLKRGFITEARDFYTLMLERIDSQYPEEFEAPQELVRLKSVVFDRLAGALMNMGDHLGSRAAAEQAVALARQVGDQRILAIGLGTLAIGAAYSGDPEYAATVANESLELCTLLGFKWEVVWALMALEHIAGVKGNQAEKQHYHDQVQATMRKMGIPANPADDVIELSNRAFQAGDLEQAKVHADTALAILAEQGDTYNLVFFQSSAAHALRLAGEIDPALEYYRTSIRLWQDFGHRAAVAHQLECFAILAEAQAKLPRAARLLGAAEALRQVSNSVRVSNEQQDFEALKSRLQKELPEQAFNAAWQAGERMSMEAAVDLAVGD